MFAVEVVLPYMLCCPPHVLLRCEEEGSNVVHCILSHNSCDVVITLTGLPFNVIVHVMALSQKKINHLFPEWTNPLLRCGFGVSPLSPAQQKAPKASGIVEAFAWTSSAHKAYRPATMQDNYVRCCSAQDLFVTLLPSSLCGMHMCVGVACAVLETTNRGSRLTLFARGPKLLRGRGGYPSFPNSGVWGCSLLGSFKGSSTLLTIEYEQGQIDDQWATTPAMTSNFVLLLTNSGHHT